MFLDDSAASGHLLMARKEWPGFVKKPNAPVVGHYLPPSEIILLVIAFALWAVRIYGRAAILKTPGLDDLFISLALLCAVILTVTHMLAINYGLGRHYHDLYRPDASRLWLTEFIQEWVFPMGALFTKLSILFFYLRFASAVSSSKFRITVYATMGFCVVWTVGICIAITLACHPIRKWWSYTTPYGYCWTPYTIGVVLFVQQTLNVISDFMVFLLPIHIIWKIHASRTKKLRMVALLGLGFLVCVVALVRIKLILLFLYHSDDNSWYAYAVYASIGIELNLTIACACLPFCKPVIRAVMPTVHRFSSSTSSRFQRFKSKVSSHHFPSRHGSHSHSHSRAPEEDPDLEMARSEGTARTRQSIYDAEGKDAGVRNSKAWNPQDTEELQAPLRTYEGQDSPTVPMPVAFRPFPGRDRIMTVEELEQAMGYDRQRRPSHASRSS